MTYCVYCITCQRKLPDGTWKITEVVDLTGIENGRYVLQPLIRHTETGFPSLKSGFCFNDGVVRIKAL